MRGITKKQRTKQYLCRKAMGCDGVELSHTRTGTKNVNEIGAHSPIGRLNGTQNRTIHLTRSSECSGNVDESAEEPTE